MKRNTCALFLCLLLSGPLAGGAREVRLAILHTTDLHGHVRGEGGSGGLLRCATLIEQARAESPNALLVDCGDLIQGTAESLLSGGRVMVRALDYLRYDVWVVGNHDFDWGWEELAALQKEGEVGLLGANVTCQPGGSHPLDQLKPFVTRELDGVRVVLVGLTTPAVPSWLLPEQLGPLLFQRSVDALRAVMPAVRAAEPDVLVLLMHHGLHEGGDDAANEIHAVARSFPEFDVILGGHLHRPIASASMGSSLYAQAGCHGAGLGRVDLVYDTVQARVVEKRGQWMEAGPQVAEHESLRQWLAADLDRADAFLDRTIGTNTCTLDAATRLPAQSGVQQLIAAAIADAVKADVVLHGVLGEEDLPAGPVTQRDIWRLVPYENRIGCARLTLGEIREVMEENASQAGSTHFMGVWGLAYDITPGAPPGRRVRNLRLPDGSVPHARRRFRVALSSYALASGGGRFPRLRRIAGRPESRLEITEIDTRRAVADYVRKRSPLRIGAGTTVKLVRARGP